MILSCEIQSYVLAGSVTACVGLGIGGVSLMVARIVSLRRIESIMISIGMLQELRKEEWRPTSISHFPETRDRLEQQVLNARVKYGHKIPTYRVYTADPGHDDIG